MERSILCQERYNNEIELLRKNGEVPEAQLKNLKKELATCKTEQEGNYLAPQHTQETPEEISDTHKQLYYEALGISEAEFQNLANSKITRNFLNQITNKQSYTGGNWKDDIYFLGEELSPDAFVIDIRPHRIANSISNYELELDKKIPLELLEIEMYEKALLQILQQNHISVSNLQKEIINLKQKYDFISKKAKKLDGAGRFFSDFLVKNSSLSSAQFKEQLEKTPYYKAVDYDIKIQKRIKENFQKAQEIYGTKVRLRGNTIEFSPSGNFSTDRKYVSPPSIHVINDTLYKSNGESIAFLDFTYLQKHFFQKHLQAFEAQSKNTD